MKITKQQLKRLIKEELRLIKEFQLPDILPDPGQAGGMAAIIADVQEALRAMANGDVDGALQLLQEVVAELENMKPEKDPGRTWRPETPGIVP